MNWNIECKQSREAGNSLNRETEGLDKYIYMTIDNNSKRQSKI